MPNRSNRITREAIDASRDIKSRLDAVHDDLDSLLVSSASLVAVLPAARLKAGLQSFIGQDALERSISELAAVARVRRGFNDLHMALAQDGVDIGLLRPEAVGDVREKPPFPQLMTGDSFPAETPPQLRVVGEA